MKTAAKVQKSEFGGFDVIDTRSGETIKSGITGSKAAAYVEHYNQEIEKAEKLWKTF